MHLKTALIIPDLHIPFHCKHYLDLIISIGSDYHKKSAAIDQIILLGDLLDFFGVSLHPKLPSAMSVRATIRDEIYQGNQFFDLLKKNFKGAQIVYLEGNHEQRLSRYIAQKCPDLFDLINIKDLLQLEKRGVKFVPFARHGSHQLFQVLNSSLYARHAPPSQGENCASETLKKKHCSLVFGHTHRAQSFTAKNLNGVEMSCYSLGCGIDFESPVFSYMDTDNWAKRFAFCRQFSNDENDWLMDVVEVKNNTAFFDGHIYQSEHGLDL